MAHPEQNEREFIAAALRGWGYGPLPRRRCRRPSTSPSVPGLVKVSSGPHDAGNESRRVADAARKDPPAAGSCSPGWHRTIRPMNNSAGAAALPLTLID